MIVDKKISCISCSPAQTRKLGILLARFVLSGWRGGAKAVIITLAGDLGAGKTKFSQGLAAGLKIRGTVNSPTFTIIKSYLYNAPGRSGKFYHVDCYRLGDKTELQSLGINDIFREPNAIIVIEWPAIVKDILPPEDLRVDFEMTGKNQRRIVVAFKNAKASFPQ